MYPINHFKEMNRLEKIAITKHAKERLAEREIKAYYPDSTQWEADLKTRKER